MKLQLLPSTFDEDGSPSARQHLSCLVVNDRVAVDAGSLAMAATNEHRAKLRDVVLTHAHLDHIAGLPLFIDDLFASLSTPVRIHALKDVIEVLERHVFNWSVFPRFSELTIGKTSAVVYHPVEFGTEFKIGALTFQLFPTDHRVPSAGVILSDGMSAVAVTGDTSNLDGLVRNIQDGRRFNAVLVECAFPDELGEIAKTSHHMTPSVLAEQLNASGLNCPVFVINVKANYREKVVRELADLNIEGLEIMEVGKAYFW